MLAAVRRITFWAQGPLGLTVGLMLGIVEDTRG